MGRFIDEEELQKYIMHDGCEKGCGYIDERDLKYIPTVEAIPKAQYDELKANITMMRLDYEARLKDDMVAMLTELQLEIKNLKLDYPVGECTHPLLKIKTTEYQTKTAVETKHDCVELIQQKIDELKE